MDKKWLGHAPKHSKVKKEALHLLEMRICIFLWACANFDLEAESEKHLERRYGGGFHHCVSDKLPLLKVLHQNSDKRGMGAEEEAETKL